MTQKEAIFETARHGIKALRQSFGGGTELSAAPGIFHEARQQAVGRGNALMDTLRAAGIDTHRARVKTPESITAKGLTEVPDDLLGMQVYGRSPEEVAGIQRALEAAGVENMRASAKTRPGYHGINIKGQYQGTPVEMQVSPSRRSNAGALLEHALGYKVDTEAPYATHIDKWIGKHVAPKMVNWDTLGDLDPSWINERLSDLASLGIDT